MSRDDLIKRISANRLLDDLWDLVRIPSPTGRERNAALRYAEMLEKAGAEIEVDDSRRESPSIIGRLHGKATGNTVQLAGHIDHIDVPHAPAERTAEVVRGRLQEAGAGEVKVEPAIRVGDPAHEILRYVEENAVSLIVMATHGHSGIRQWVLGSVAVKLCRSSNVPIRLVRSLRSDEAAPEDWPERRILVLLDGSEWAEQVLPYVADHARLSDAEVTLLRVCEPPTIPSDRHDDGVCKKI